MKVHQKNLLEFMNKQIEQVETIMTKHAERVCIKRKKIKLEWVLSNFFFQVLQEDMENKSIQ